MRKFLEISNFIISTKKRLNFLLSSEFNAFLLKMCRDYRSEKAAYEELGSLSSLVQANVSQSRSKTEIRYCLSIFPRCLA